MKPLVVGCGLALIWFGAPCEVAAETKPEREKIRVEVEKLLREELNRRWYPNAIDMTDGGFHQTFARDWTPLPDENRFLVYQARMTWTAAAFAEFSEDDREAYLKHARYGVEYLERAFRDRESGGFHFVVDRQGRFYANLGSEKHVYATAFALYAASRAYAASKDEKALRLARDVFDWLETRAHDAEHGGYFESFTKDGKPIPPPAEGLPMRARVDRLGVYHGYKSMNSHIHLLEALAEFYRVEKTEPVRKRLEETLAIVRDRIVVEPGAMNLYFTRDWRPTPAHDSFGHDVETAYLLVEAAEALGLEDDAKTWKAATSLVDHALDFGWDQEFGGFYDKGDVFAGAVYDTTKVWWTQAEGLNALMLMHRRHGRRTDRYWRAFVKQWEFVSKHQIDAEHGGWFGEVARDGKLIGDGRKATQWKANYHTSRALMNVATMLKD